ncbi:MAG: HDOD domain-containing protein [Spartobacteria bacterium]|nr:HDOD domain-containing protein [Spartobacteria bacterium]
MTYDRASLRFQIERVAKNVGSMPVPTVIRHSIDALRDEGTVSDIARIIESDTALIVKVLRSINSAAYGLPRKIANINEAVALLGYRQLIDICKDTPTFTDAQEQTTTYGFNVLDLWLHSLGTALAAKLIIEQLRARSDPTAFIAGILSNFGRYLLAVNYWNDFTLALKLCHDNDISLRHAERRIFGVSSEVVGGWAMGALELDDTLCHAVRDRFSKSGGSYSWVLDLSTVIADGLGMGYSGEHNLPLLRTGLLEQNGIDHAVFESIVEMVDSQYADIRTSKNYAAIREIQHRKGDNQS